MAAHEISDRSDRLFGREPDLNKLLPRANRTGLTAVVGPPQIGKSWLLMELASRLAKETSPPNCVGFTRSPKGAPDPLLQVVSDLYQRWLDDAPAWEQLRTSWDQQKSGLLPNFAKFVGKLFDKTTQFVPGVGVLISESLNGLVAANEDLRSGRLVVSRLEYSQAQELVSSVSQIANRPVVLLMDQWEETPDLKAQLNTFRDFLRQPEHWPRCHIFLGAREGSDAAAMLEELQDEYPGAATVHKLGEMDLASKNEKQRMLRYLRAHVTGIKSADDDTILDLVGGYPRVIDRLTADDARDTAHTLDGCRSLQRDSILFRYRDLERLLRALDDDHRKLAARIALVPLAEDAAAWPALEPIVMPDIDPAALDDLKRAKILDTASESPSFGHAKRRAAARTFLEKDFVEAVKTEARFLTLSLARSVTSLDAGMVHSVSALRELRDVTSRRNLGPVPRALCQAAATMFGEHLASPADLIEGARKAKTSSEPGIRLVFAAGLFNALMDAKIEGALVQRDTLLDNLRTLAQAYPNDAAVREILANGLSNTLLDARAEGALAWRDRLLEELRTLARTYPYDDAVRKNLNDGIRDTLIAAKREGALTRCDELLNELRTLNRAHPKDDAVRTNLANALYDELFDRKVERTPAQLDALREELRALSDVYWNSLAP